ncbi:MAG: DUF2079 domain-containing protein [Patescibacteria group bacterium]
MQTNLMKKVITYFWEILLFGLLFAYLFIFIHNTLIRHWSFSTYYYDLGIMHQVLYNTAYGRFFQLTDPNATEQISRLAIHFDPLMLIFTPFYWLFPHVETLLIGQTVLLASGAIPIFLLCKHLFKNFNAVPAGFIATFFSFLYLNYYPMQNTNISAFHAVVMVTPLFLWAAYFIETKRYKPALILLLLSMLGKENVALTVAMIGLYIALIKKERVIGFGLAAFSAVLFLFIISYLIPSNRSDLHFAESYYTLDLQTNLLRLFSEESFLYVYHLLQPVGFLSLFSPVYLLIAGPEWMLNILSKSTNMRDLQYHYTALLTPFIFISALFGLRTIITYAEKYTPKINLRYVLLFVIAVVLSFNLYTTSKHNLLHLSKIINQPRLTLVRSIEERFKDDSIKVSATGHLGPYLAGRTYFYNFLFDFAYKSFGISDDDLKKVVSRYESADYVVIQKGEVENQIPIVLYYYKHLTENPKFEKVFDKQGFEIYHKLGAPTVNLEGI